MHFSERRQKQIRDCIQLLTGAYHMHEVAFTNHHEGKGWGLYVATPGRDLSRGWGTQGFPIPEVDFPSLEFLKYT